MVVLIGIALAAGALVLTAQWLRRDEVTGRTRLHRVSNGLGAISAVIVAVLLAGLGWWPLAPAFAMFGILQAIWVFSPDPPRRPIKRRANRGRTATGV